MLISIAGHLSFQSQPFGLISSWALGIHRKCAELRSSGMAVGMSFYPDGSTSGVCDRQRRQGAFGQTGGGRRESDLSTFLASSVGSHYQRNDWSNAGGHEQPAQPPGRWYWTPQLWVWGSTLEEAIQEYLSKGWMTLDAELIDFLHESVDCQSQRSVQAQGLTTDQPRGLGPFWILMT